MKDVARDELQYKLFVAKINSDGGVPIEITRLLGDALEYVENNPSISQLESEIERLSEELDDHTAALSVIEALV